MVLVGPKTSASTVESFLKSVFHDDFKKAEKLERTELAYEINKTKHAQYFLVNLETERKNIAEFIRLSNINKEIWRHLVVNLDTEKGLNKVFKTHRKFGHDFKDQRSHHGQAGEFRKREPQQKSKEQSEFSKEKKSFSKSVTKKTVVSKPKETKEEK